MGCYPGKYGLKVVPPTSATARDASWEFGSCAEGATQLERLFGVRKHHRRLLEEVMVVVVVVVAVVEWSGVVERLQGFDTTF